MKEFNPEEAKQGAAVCTRDGRKARIVCFDDKCINFPIIAAIEYDDSEQLSTYRFNGRYTEDGETDYDLMMVTKHEGWINIYKDALINHTIQCVFNTKEQALDSKLAGYITTIKIEWEE